MVNLGRFAALIVVAILTLQSIVLCLKITLSRTVWNGQQDEQMTTGANTSFVVNPLFQEQYDKVDGTNDTTRCASYDFSYIKGQKRRRIFFGAMVADDSYDVIRMHAAEIYGLYDVVALVESNTTHTGKRRVLRFAPGTEGYDLIQSGIFGPHTKVFLDLYLDNAFGAIEMDREEIQRQNILKRWKKAGMREDDVGLMADMDETFTRDFLHAVIACDIPMFRPGQNCLTPRVFAWSLVFESSPECVSKDMRWLWYHPDVMIGECIEYIGNPRGRPTPVREYKGVHGERVYGWGKNSSEDYPEDVIKNGSYPLANAADMRIGVFNYALGVGSPEDYDNIRVGAFHFHNFFETGEVLRHKYNTYAHPLVRAKYMKLSDIHNEDLDMLVRCARDLPNSANPTSKDRFEGGFNSYVGSKPIYFLNETYRKLRHAEVKRIIEEDERKHGSKYPANTSSLATG